MHHKDSSIINISLHQINRSFDNRYIIMSDYCVANKCYKELSVQQSDSHLSSGSFSYHYIRMGLWCKCFQFRYPYLTHQHGRHGRIKIVFHIIVLVCLRCNRPDTEIMNSDACKTGVSLIIQYICVPNSFQYNNSLLNTNTQ